MGRIVLARRLEPGSSSIITCGYPRSMAGATGLEPATSGVTGRRSNQLSYAPSALDRACTLNPPAQRCQAGARRSYRPSACRLASAGIAAPAGPAFPGPCCALCSGLQWWAMRDSNPRPPRCKRGALPAELIALDRSGQRPKPATDLNNNTGRRRPAPILRPLIQRIAQTLPRLELGLL